MKSLREGFFCLKIASAIALGLLFSTCGGSGGGDGSGLTGDLSQVTVESQTVDPSSQFTPSVTASVGSNGTLEFDSSPVDVDGDGTQDEVTVSSVSATEYAGSVSAPLDADIDKAVTMEFECQDTTSSSSISLLGADIDMLFPGKYSCTTDCGTTVRVRKVNCAVTCEDFAQDQGRFTFTLVLLALAHGFSYQSIVNAVIFLALTC